MPASVGERTIERLRTALAMRAVTGPESGSAAAEDALEALADVDLTRYEPRWAEACTRLGLDALSGELLLLAAAPELDGRCGAACAALDGRPLATIRGLVSLLTADGGDAAEVLARLDAAAPLRHGGALSLLDAEGALLDRPLAVAPELVSLLLATTLDDDARLRRIDPPGHPLGRADAAARIRAAVALPDGPPLLVAGPDAAELIAVALDRGLVLVEAGEPELLARARLVAALERRELVVRLGPEDRPRAAPARVLCGDARAAHELGALVVEVPMPSLADRRATWRSLAPGLDTGEVAAKFRLSAKQIARALEAARVEARLAGLAAPGVAELDAGARQASHGALAERATRLAAGQGWDDLVLPERELALLKSISSYLRHRDRVLDEWGYERATPGRQGLAVLFAGESGTGKTMAAKVLARDLGLDLFAVALPTVVSKYVGETEQNLERIFASAEAANAILFFDEADALFARRTGVGEASDRYANLEVAYLLQRMEAHPGAVILATNLKQNIDDAFLRRLDFVVDFRFPEPADRRRIWALAIPPAAPVADDLDLDYLGDHFKLSGGSIRNCSLAAAFDAAASAEPLSMAHLLRAVAAEYRKLGRLTVEADFEPAVRPRPTPPQPPPAPAPTHERLQIGSRIEEL